MAGWVRCSRAVAHIESTIVTMNNIYRIHHNDNHNGKINSENGIATGVFRKYSHLAEFAFEMDIRVRIQNFVISINNFASDYWEFCQESVCDSVPISLRPCFCEV